ncbi:glutathione S-transferase U8-like [Impatiens glandulifera]|uniref:glutathione S-transferase U8-like n=1 Tax=Impatiens glandulifera TaxID=253017 RepID=UPI001FB18686|nr:glutathione S-transferase U8-like [Impatiens glandulifera]
MRKAISMAGIEKEYLKLLGTKLSSFCNRVEFALKLKGIEYEFVNEDLQNKSSMLLGFNPVYKKVPVLVHHGKSISESRVILDYIEDRWPLNPILPKDPLERAYMRFWAKFVDEKLIEAFKMACYGEDQQSKGICLVEEVLMILEKEKAARKENTFFGGETIGYLDIVMGWIAYWFKYAEEAGQLDLMDAIRYPHLMSWIHEFLQVSIVQEVIPTPSEMRKVCQYLQVNYQKWFPKRLSRT